MNTLLIDTHSDFIFLAIYQNGKLKLKKEIFEKKDHSTICMPLLLELLKSSNLKLDDINELIVVNGPGSFTGERIGVTIAKTLAFCKDIPIRTISSLELYLNEESKKYNYLALEEKNGYYVGHLNNGKILDYNYVKKSDWANWINDKKIYLCQNINYEDLWRIANQKETLNPHFVNPFYVKKIEAEND